MNARELNHVTLALQVGEEKYNEMVEVTENAKGGHANLHDPWDVMAGIHARIGVGGWKSRLQ